MNPERYNGNEKALYSYDAFGNPRYAVEFTFNVWRYTGEQRDADSGPRGQSPSGATRTKSKAAREGC